RPPAYELPLSLGAPPHHPSRGAPPVRAAAFVRCTTTPTSPRQPPAYVPRIACRVLPRLGHSRVIDLSERCPRGSTYAGGCRGKGGAAEHLTKAAARTRGVAAERVVRRSA